MPEVIDLDKIDAFYGRHTTAYMPASLRRLILAGNTIIHHNLETCLVRWDFANSEPETKDTEAKQEKTQRKIPEVHEVIGLRVTGTQHLYLYDVKTGKYRGQVEF